MKRRLSRTGAAVGRGNGHGQEFTPSLVGCVDSSVNHSFEMIRRSRGPSIECPRLAHPARRPYDRFLAFSARTGLIGKASSGSTVT